MPDLEKTTASKYTSNCKNLEKIYLDPAVSSLYLGLIDYDECMQLQNELWQFAKTSSQNYILGLEHSAVLTLGYRADLQNELIEDLAIKISRTSRGGLATIHNEGQLVIYPILNLNKFNLGVRRYILLLLRTTQELLVTLNIQSHLDEKNIGLFTSAGKIAFCGVQIKNGISLHGLSLNVNNDLNIFSKIKSCGVKSSLLDKVLNYTQADLNTLYAAWVRIFIKNLIK